VKIQKSGFIAISTNAERSIHARGAEAGRAYCGSRRGERASVRSKVNCSACWAAIRADEAVR
jgi:hypothetical protein